MLGLRPNQTLAEVVPRSAQPLTATLVRAIFDQPDAASEILLVLAVWCVPAVLLFFLIYWAIRLAIRHEKRRMPSAIDPDREAAAGRRRRCKSGLTCPCACAPSTVLGRQRSQPGCWACLGRWRVEWTSNPRSQFGRLRYAIR